jgi:holin-like protein
MTNAMAVLLSCQLAGEMAARGLGIPIPGPVLGLALLTMALVALPRLRDSLETSNLGKMSIFLTGGMGIMFVPAGVGVVQQLAQLQLYALPLALTIVASTAITLLCTLGTFVGVKRWMGDRS